MSLLLSLPCAYVCVLIKGNKRVCGGEIYVSYCEEENQNQGNDSK